MFARSLKPWVNGAVLATAATISLAHPISAQAHRRFEIALALGAFAPTAQLPAPFFFGCPAIKPRPAYCDVPIIPESQNTAVAVGGRITTRFNTRGAIEAAFWYTPSGVTGSYFEGSGQVILADMRLVLNLTPHARTTSVLLMGGPAVIHRSGDAWTRIIGTTSPALSLGAGLDISPRSGLRVRAQVGDYLSRVSFREPGIPGKVQHDLVVSLSLSPSIGGSLTP